MLKVCEIFPSLQGEGILIGTPMVFIRLSGCNLQCEWCDTKYSWTEGKLMKEQEIVEEVKNYAASWVCITGGEPLLQNLTELVGLLVGRSICLETNGTLPLPVEIDAQITLLSISPKLKNSGMLGKLNRETLAELLRHPVTQLKFVVEKTSDVMEALQLCNELKNDFAIALTHVPIIFQPQGLPTKKPEYIEQMDETKMNLVTYLRQLAELWGFVQGCQHIYRGWDLRVLPQLHRLIFGPGVRKV